MNQKDASVLSPKYIRDNLIAKYPGLNVLFKQGKKGCTIITKDLEIQCPSAPGINPKILEENKIVDCVGAGDCFTAAFFVKYIEILSKLSQN